MIKTWTHPCEARAPLPVRATGTLLPPIDDVPAAYRDEKHPYAQLMNNIIVYAGTRVRFFPREGVDEKQAMRHLRACLNAYEPDLADKIPGMAFLIDQWFHAVFIKCLGYYTLYTNTERHLIHEDVFAAAETLKDLLEFTRQE